MTRKEGKFSETDLLDVNDHKSKNLGMMQETENEEALQYRNELQAENTVNDTLGLKIIHVWSEKEQCCIQHNQTEHHDNASTHDALLRSYKNEQVSPHHIPQQKDVCSFGSRQNCQSKYVSAEWFENYWSNHSLPQGETEKIHNSVSGDIHEEECGITKNNSMEVLQDTDHDSLVEGKDAQASGATSEFHISEKELEMDIMQDLLGRMGYDQNEEMWNHGATHDYENRSGKNVLGDNNNSRSYQEEVGNNATKQTERKSKAEDKVWCVCRSTDISGFMIGCNNCKEWYHGSCIGIGGKEAETIDKFYCDTCLAKDPRMRIVYKPGMKAKFFQTKEFLPNEEMRQSIQKDKKSSSTVDKGSRATDLSCNENSVVDSESEHNLQISNRGLSNVVATEKSLRIILPRMKNLEHRKNLSSSTIHSNINTQTKNQKTTRAGYYEGQLLPKDGTSNQQLTQKKCTSDYERLTRKQCTSNQQLTPKQCTSDYQLMTQKKSAPDKQGLHQKQGASEEQQVPHKSDSFDQHQVNKKQGTFLVIRNDLLKSCNLSNRIASEVSQGSVHQKQIQGTRNVGDERGNNVLGQIKILRGQSSTEKEKITPYKVSRGFLLIPFSSDRSGYGDSQSRIQDSTLNKRPHLSQCQDKETVHKEACVTSNSEPKLLEQETVHKEACVTLNSEPQLLEQETVRREACVTLNSEPQLLEQETVRREACVTLNSEPQLLEQETVHREACVNSNSEPQLLEQETVHREACVNSNSEPQLLEQETVHREACVNSNSEPQFLEHKNQQRMDKPHLRKKKKSLHKVKGYKRHSQTKSMVEFNPYQKRYKKNASKIRSRGIYKKVGNIFDVLREELPRMENKRNVTEIEILEEARSAIQSLQNASFRLKEESLKEVSHNKKLKSKLEKAKKLLEVQKQVREVTSTKSLSRRKCTDRLVDPELITRTSSPDEPDAKRLKCMPDKNNTTGTILQHEVPMVQETSPLQGDSDLQRQPELQLEQSNNRSGVPHKNVIGGKQSDNKPDRLRKRKLSPADKKHTLSGINMSPEDSDGFHESDVDSVVDPDYQPTSDLSSDTDSSVLEDFDRSEKDAVEEQESDDNSSCQSGSVMTKPLSKNIYVQRLQSGYTGKRHACFYCSKILPNIARHLAVVHHKEADVAKILKHPKKSKERRNMWQELVNKGDFHHNIEVLDKGDGMIIPKKRCKEKENRTLVPCQYCKAFYSVTDLKKHSSYCVAQGGGFTKDPKKIGKRPVEDSSKDVGFSSLCDRCQCEITKDQNTSDSESNSKSMKLPTHNQQPKKVYIQNSEISKRHACFFCDKLTTKISRHLVQVHSDEEDVAKILKLPKKSKERKNMWLELVNKGNFSHNIKVLDKGDGMVIPKRRCKDNEVRKLVPCQGCKAFYTRTELWKHSKLCVARGEGPVKNHIRNGLILLPVKNCSKDLANNVLCIMKDDEVKDIIQSDPRILDFGERLYEKHVYTAQYISQKLREIGRLVVESKKMSEDICCIDDLLKTEHWNLLIKSVQIVSGYDSRTLSYAAPSLALKIGYSLQKCAQYLQSQGCTERNETKERIAGNFLKKYESDWNDSICGEAVSSLADRKYGRPLLLPVVENVVKLNTYLRKEINTNCKALKEKFDISMYTILAQMCLVIVILFNRRRKCEVERMTLKNFVDSEKKKGEPDAAVSSTLSEFEKKLCKTHSWIEIKGKRGRKEALLFTKEMMESIELLISNREKAHASTEFLFSKPGKAKFPYSGIRCLRKFAKEAGVQDLNALTSLNLRKQLGTLAQILNSDDAALDISSILKERGIVVCQGFDSFQEDTLQTAKVAKVLNDINNGAVTKFQGMNFEDMKLAEEETLELECESSEDEEAAATRIRTNKSGQKKRHNWTIEEKSALKRKFRKEIESGKVPGKRLCLNAIKTEPYLRKFTWVVVKSAVHNFMKEAKAMKMAQKS